jgi:hypothetical protein
MLLRLCFVLTLAVGIAEACRYFDPGVQAQETACQGDLSRHDNRVA